MSNISGILNIGSTALLAQQRAIDVTGNNIANVDTPGYSRQRVSLVQNSPVRDNWGVSSTGVTAEPKVKRTYDQFVANQLNAQNESLGRWQAQESTLEKVEAVFDESSGFGLNNAMSEFWSAWQDLANNPSGSVERNAMVSSGQYLSSVFNQLNGGLAQLHDDIDVNIRNKTDEINHISAQIADLNQKIRQVEINGQNANDYRDDRDLAIQSLSKIIDIESFEDNLGNVTVMAGGGKPLVDGVKSWRLSTADNSSGLKIFWADSSGNTTDITNEIGSGELKGYLECRDVIVSGYIDSLNELAGAIVSEVNLIHSQGVALDGTNGNNFFTAGSDASNISVDSSIIADVDRISAASASEAIPGGNQTALAIAELQNSLTMFGNSATFDDHYNVLIGDIGHDVETAKVNVDHETTMLHYLENYRDERAGVSLDEEMVNLVKHQHAYSAAAKLITTVDEMMDTLLSMIH